MYLFIILFLDNIMKLYNHFKDIQIIILYYYEIFTNLFIIVCGKEIMQISGIDGVRRYASLCFFFFFAIEIPSTYFFLFYLEDIL